MRCIEWFLMNYITSQDVSGFYFCTNIPSIYIAKSNHSIADMHIAHSHVLKTFFDIYCMGKCQRKSQNQVSRFGLFLDSLSIQNILTNIHVQGVAISSTFSFWRISWQFFETRNMCKKVQNERGSALSCLYWVYVYYA